MPRVPTPPGIPSLSLHDALPISLVSYFRHRRRGVHRPSIGPREIVEAVERIENRPLHAVDRKSTRLNSSHTVISYAVFCLKKKNHRAAPLHREHPTAAHTLAVYR